MATSLESVNVIILGGLTHLSRPLLVHLVKLHESPKIKRIRVVDKYLVDGQACTVYMDSASLEALKDPRVEYRQANLNMAATVSSCFDLPDGEKFDFVFDLAGEGIMGSDFSSQLMLERTTKLAGLLASEAEKRNVRAYVRDTPPYWTSKPDEGPWKESNVTKRSLAYGVRAYFYYEAERAAANSESLPLVLLRSAAIYGPHQYHGLINPMIALAEVYRHLNEPMKVLWNADLRINSLHTRDWCRAAWKAALWCSQRSREQANAEAGEELPRINPKDKAKYGGFNVDEDIERCCPRKKCPTAPVFNVVDDRDTNLGVLLKAIGEVYNIETGFTNAAINTWAKLNLNSVTADMNEKHAEGLNALLEQAKPPITNSPFTCYHIPEDVANRGVWLDGSKFKRVTGWKATESVNKQSLEETINSFKQNGTWVCH